MAQIYGYLRLGCMAGLAYISFLQFQQHDLTHAGLSLALALLAAR